MRCARALCAAGIATMLLAVAAAPAAALDSLEDYLAEAQNAEYAGRRIVVASWQGEAEIGTFEVTRAREVTVLGDGGTQVASGRVTADDVAVAVLQWSRSQLADRYTVVEAGPVERLGRSSHSIDVYEGDLLRAALVFDDATGAPLLTEMFDASGERYRFSAMLEFDDRPNLVYSSIGTPGRDYEVMVPSDDSRLPGEVAGYLRTDIYGTTDAWVQTFYSDGLFSFSVFEAAGSMRLGEFGDAGTFRAEGVDYELLVRPTEVWVTWRGQDATYVLVGDLPPDHLEDVLEALPSPDRPGLFKRLWRGLFG
jgi:hypothetical protein